MECPSQLACESVLPRAMGTSITLDKWGQDTGARSVRDGYTVKILLTVLILLDDED